MVGQGSWDPTWESIFASRPWGAYPPESIVRGVMRQYGGMSDRSLVRALDVGCGPGANTWFLAREGFSVCGIDGSPTAIERARARLTSEGLSADLRVGDFTDQIPWPDSTFDLALDCAALYANPLRGIRSAVREVHRVLKPGGSFISLAFTDRTWGYGTGEPGIDPGGFARLADGPLAESGYVQFLGREEVDDVYGVFAHRSVERSSYTLQGMERMIEQWVITASRGGDG